MKYLKFFLIFFFTNIILINSSSSQSRFGELTEIRDKKMRGKENQWVRPHPGPFVWNKIEKEQGSFYWEETDAQAIYSQEHEQTIIATIWPHANWEQNPVKEKKPEVLSEKILQNI